MKNDQEIFSDNRDFVVELGSGNGKMLYDLACNTTNDFFYYVGIEKEKNLYDQSRALVDKNVNNISFLNDDFETVIHHIRDQSINTFMFVLPHPDFICNEREFIWKSLYCKIKDKLKQAGRLVLITEYTNELLSPVTSVEYLAWKNWLISTFIELGFKISGLDESVPQSYTSYYVKKFSQDPERIKILTIIFSKE